MEAVLNGYLAAQAHFLLPAFYARQRKKQSSSQTRHRGWPSQMYLRVTWSQSTKRVRWKVKVGDESIPAAVTAPRSLGS